MKYLKDKKNDLFELIHSLTKSEKRYFKVFSSLQNGQKNYLKLFDAIEGQKQPDENELKKILSGERLVRNLHVAKKYLFDLILKSMRSYNAGKITGSLIKEHISDINFLLRKGLKSSVKKIIKGASEIVERNEEFIAHLELINLERQYILQSNMVFEEKEKATNEFLIKQNILLKKIQNHGEYAALSNKILFLHQKTGIARTQSTLYEVSKIMQHPLLKNESRAFSKEALVLYYNIHSIAEYIKNNFKKSLDSKTKLLAVFESDDYRIARRPLAYAESLHDVLVAKCLLNNFDVKFYNTLNKLKSFPFGPFIERSGLSEIKTRVFYLSTPIELYAFKITGAFTNALKIIPSIEKQIEIYGRKINQVDIYTPIIQIYFATEDYKNARKWIDKMRSELNSEKREDLQAVTRLINLIVHFELKNRDGIEHIVRSVYRELEKYKRLYKFEKSILSFFRGKILETGDKTREASTIFYRLKKELLEVMKDPKEAVIAEHFDFISWLDSKIQNRTFADILKEKFTKKY